MGNHVKQKINEKRRKQGIHHRTAAACSLKLNRRMTSKRKKNNKRIQMKWRRRRRTLNGPKQQRQLLSVRSSLCSMYRINVVVFSKRAHVIKHYPTFSRRRSRSRQVHGSCGHRVLRAPICFCLCSFVLHRLRMLRTHPTATCMHFTLQAIRS